MGLICKIFTFPAPACWQTTCLPNQPLPRPHHPPLKATNIKNGADYNHSLLDAAALAKILMSASLFVVVAALVLI